jgi:hypothetical protein
MFQFAAFALHTYVFSMQYPKRVGCPIRKSADQSVFAHSPQLIASYYVLHRL